MTLSLSKHAVALSNFAVEVISKTVPVVLVKPVGSDGAFDAVDTETSPALDTEPNVIATGFASDGAVTCALTFEPVETETFGAAEGVADPVGQALRMTATTMRPAVRSRCAFMRNRPFPLELRAECTALGRTPGLS